MKHEKKPDGGLKLEFDAREAVLLRYLAERATFVDTPPEEQDAIYELGERILAALGPRSGS
jgi:hypothetical protein